MARKSGGKHRQVSRFRAQLPADFSGDILVDRAHRAIYASDAGNYRIPPQIIVRPRTDLALKQTVAAALACGIPITARGAGTSCAGNAIGPGIVIDYARYLNRIIELNPEAGWAIVEPGVVQAQLQTAAKPYGLRFGPDPSTSSRCTIGGMVGNNACGPHATAYGRTSDNILGLEFIDGWGRLIQVKVPDKAGRRKNLLAKDPDSAAGESDDGLAAFCNPVKLGKNWVDNLAVVPGLSAVVRANLQLIRQNFGRFSRQVSGYSMEHLLPENGGDLTRFFVGTEGTLGVLTKVKVRLVPLPSAPVLVALGFTDMIQAAAAVPRVLPFAPLAVEGMDARLVEVVRQHHGPGAVPELPRGAGWLLCEVGGPDLDEAASLKLARELAAASGADPQAVMIYPPGQQAAALWRIRADGAGLGGRTPPREGKPGQQAWPGWEDAAVPPEHLADYLRDFQQLMARYDLDGLLYGHFGDGCVHVRLNLPLGSQAGAGKARQFLFEAARLVGRYRGSISGEHGDGRARSELLGQMYPPGALHLFAQVKQLFDPNNLMNPGVITGLPSLSGREPQAELGNRGSRAGQGKAAAERQVTAGPKSAVDHRSAVDRVDQYLRRPLARQFRADGGFAFEADQGDLTAAFHRCTGVGKCRADNRGSNGFMCPSFLATGEEKDATRARARILQEATTGQLIRDLSDPEIWSVLDLCLACKACSSECPTGVDIARWRSEVLYRRYRGKLRPLSHYLLGWLPRWLRLAAKIPGLAQLANQVMSVSALKGVAFRVAGIAPQRQMPALATERLQKWARCVPGLVNLPAGRNAGLGALEPGVNPKPVPGVQSTADQGVKPGSECAQRNSTVTGEDPKPVVLWVDSFSHGLDNRGAKAAAQLLLASGWRVFLTAPDTCCGLTWITTGQLSGARKALQNLLADLAPFAANRIPIIGVEPSCTAVIRDDLAELLPGDSRVPMLQAGVFTLSEFLAKYLPDLQLPDLSGQTIVAQPHCHHYSVMGWEADRHLLQKTGANLVELSGCCGLAGNFGMEKGHLEMSKAVAGNSLLPALAKYPQAIYLADGFSCRTQAEQLTQRSGIHLAQLLLGGLGGGKPQSKYGR